MRKLFLMIFCVNTVCFGGDSNNGVENWVMVNSNLHTATVANPVAADKGVQQGREAGIATDSSGGVGRIEVVVAAGGDSKLAVRDLYSAPMRTTVVVGHSDGYTLRNCCSAVAKLFKKLNCSRCSPSCCRSRSRYDKKLNE
jgi:hypothetical protein